MSSKSLVNQAGMDLIKTHEGFSSVPYICPGGKITIGYGHVILPDEKFTTITEAQAVSLLIKDIEIAERAVLNLVTVQLSRNQFAALVSFVFNIGATNFKNSTLLKVINSENHLDAPAEFVRWRLASGKPLLGLLRRRLAESVLYLS